MPAPDEPSKFPPATMPVDVPVDEATKAKLETATKRVEEAIKVRSTFAKPTAQQLSHRFSYHAPKDDQAKRYELIRAFILECAKECVALTPCSPEQTRALNALDEAMFLFNAAIARNE
jgi:hypothetical protein